MDRAFEGQGFSIFMDKGQGLAKARPGPLPSLLVLGSFFFSLFAILIFETLNYLD